MLVNLLIFFRPTTEHSYDDIYFAVKALKQSLPLEVANSIELKQLKRLYDFSLDDLQRMLQDFTRQAGTDRESRITFEGFCRAMGVPPNPYTKKLFNMLDTNMEGTVDFRKYLAGMAMLGQELSRSEPEREKTLRFAFRLFDIDGNGSISLAELAT
jgi:Ca2+-binding EF-hand superfamily protein